MSSAKDKTVLSKVISHQTLLDVAKSPDSDCRSRADSAQGAIKPKKYDPYVNIPSFVQADTGLQSLLA